MNPRRVSHRRSAADRVRAYRTGRTVVQRRGGELYEVPGGTGNSVADHRYGGSPHRIREVAAQEAGSLATAAGAAVEARRRPAANREPINPCRGANRYTRVNTAPWASTMVAPGAVSA